MCAHVLEQLAWLYEHAVGRVVKGSVPVAMPHRHNTDTKQHWVSRM
jgi:hypothetical protein